MSYTPTHWPIAALLLALFACGAEKSGTAHADAVVGTDSAAADVGRASDSCTDDKQCADATACTFDLCNLEGKCEHKATTSACDDGNACTEGDKCAAGACSPGVVRNCQDALACTVDACDPTSGCSHSPSTAPCDDGDPCTVGDVCAGATCTAGSKGACDDGDDCTADSCKAPKALCAHTAVQSQVCAAKAWPQLAIRLADSAGDWVMVTSGTMSFNGTVLGLPDAVTWSTSYAKTGTATLDLPRFSAVVPLTNGDNLLTFLAHAGTETAQHTITVVYAPVPVFDGALRAIPLGKVVHATSKFRFEVAVATIAGGQVGKLQVHAVNAAGAAPQALGELADQGGDCDFQAGDGRFAACLSSANLPVGAHYFRAAATLKGPGMPEAPIWSLPVRVDVLPIWPSDLCNDQEQLVEVATAKWATQATKVGPVVATNAVLAELKANPMVAECGPADGGVWLRFANGVLGIAAPLEPGLRGPTSPDGYAQLLRSEPAWSGNEGDVVEAVLQQSFGCPPWAGAPTNNLVPVESARQLGRFGLGVWIGHGGVAFAGLSSVAVSGYGWHHRGPQEYVTVQGPMDCQDLGAPAGSLLAFEGYPGDESQLVGPQGAPPPLVASLWLADDLLAGRVALASGGRFALLPAFWQRHARDLPRSVVYLGTCSGAHNGSIALELLAAGASAVVSYSGVVGDAWATLRGTSLLSGIVAGKAAGSLVTPEVDPLHPKTRMRLIGDTTATSGHAPWSDGGFESDHLQGWLHPRWLQPIRALGPIGPQTGARMMMLATAYGPHAVQQSLCVPGDGDQICLDWRYLSAEPSLGCVDFDPFIVQASAVQTQPKTLLKITPTALCKPEECTTCGNALFSAFTPAQLKTGSGTAQLDAFETGWQTSCFDLSAMVGKRTRITLSLVGNDSNESVVLIDKVEVK